MSVATISPGAVSARRHDRQGADRAAAGHEDPLAEQRAGAVDGMQRDGEGLGKGGLVDRDAVGDLVALPGSATRRWRKAPWICGIGIALP